MPDHSDNTAEPTPAEPSGRMRLARFLAGAGVASRRASEELIRQGRITVNNVPVMTPAFTVDPLADVVCADGRRVSSAAPVTILLNKPRGYTCTAKDEHAERLVTELFPPQFGRLFTVGRLDCESEGLLLCTNDGDLAHRLMHPRYGVRKSYRVWVAGTVRPEQVATMLAGVTNNDEFLRAAEVSIAERYPGGTVLGMVLTEGRKREIRRLCTAVGLRVERLVRVAYGPLKLGDLATGQWRHLTAAEVGSLAEGG